MVSITSFFYFQHYQIRNYLSPYIMSTNPKRSGLQLKWNLDSVNWFHEALLEHGKDFDKISISMLKKSIRNNPQKIPNHLTSVGVRYFYYRNLRKASNLLHAYECRHPAAPGLAGVSLKKSCSNNFSTGNNASPKRLFLPDQTESSKSDILASPPVINETKPEYPDSTNSPSDYSLQEQVIDVSNGKREEPTHELSIQALNNTSTPLLIPESEESILTDNEMCTENTKELYEKNCQVQSNQTEKYSRSDEIKSSETQKLENNVVIEEPSKRDLTKEWVQVDGLGRCSLDLIAVICYTKLHTILGEKIHYRNKFLTHRITSYLGELVYKGVTKYRNRGHIKRIKLPNCKVLKTPTFNGDNQKLKLQNETVLDTHTSGINSDSSGDEHPTSTTNIAILHKTKPSKLRMNKNLFNNAKTITTSTQTENSSIRDPGVNTNNKVCIEFLPEDEFTFKVVQSIAQNPYLRIYAPQNAFFANIITLINTKWNKIFARSADLTIDFDYEFSNSQVGHSQIPNHFVTQNFTVGDLVINQISSSNIRVENISPSIRLKYHFCTNYEHVLTEGVGSQISPLSALVQLLQTINETERADSKIPIGKNFPRKFGTFQDDKTVDKKENVKNIITRNLLKDKLVKLRQIHVSKQPIGNNSHVKLDQWKRLSNKQNSSTLKSLVEYLRNHNEKLRKCSNNTNKKAPMLTKSNLARQTIPKSKNVKTTLTRSVPSSFHSVLKEKATSRSLFSSDMTEYPIPSQIHYSLSPQTDMQRLVGELSIDNAVSNHNELYFGDPCEYPLEHKDVGNEFGSLNTFSMLADAYLDLEGDSDMPTDTGNLHETIDANCPSVVSENFQSLLCELDGMVHEWDTDASLYTDTELMTNVIDPNSNPTKIFLEYFLNSHDSNESDDKVMRSIFEDDSLDGIGSQHISYNNHSYNNINNNINNNITHSGNTN